MTRRIVSRGLLVGLTATLGLGAARLEASTGGHTALAGDTIRQRLAASAASERSRTLPYPALIPGYLSARGLPPVPGGLLVTDSGLVFDAAQGSPALRFPLVTPVRSAAGRQRRASTVSLALVSDGAAGRTYLFRIDGGVFETSVPGVLLELMEHPEWLDSVGVTEWAAERPLANPSDTAALWSVARGIAASAYADTLYALFGRPTAELGLVGERGKSAGRLGEYVASRDSLALDPGRMTSEAQLRHAFAHELGHRWQARSPAQLKLLWQGVPRMSDPKRYGYGSPAEHQAEAIAFAVHFLQTTARPEVSPADALQLLEHYEFLVPGSRLITRFLALQPIYDAHPLKSDLQ